MNRVTALAITSRDANALATRTNQKPTGKRVRSVIASLTASCALMMTGFGIAMPVFARSLGELGSGVEVLSLMAMASALAQFLLAPFMGALADRFGRRRIVLLALSGLAITTLAFLVARSTETYIVLRFLQGAFSVGLLPAAMGVIADLVPEQLCESASRLTSTTGDVVCALRRATTPLASQVRYNEEVGKDAVERMAA